MSVSISKTNYAYKRSDSRTRNDRNERRITSAHSLIFKLKTYIICRHSVYFCTENDHLFFNLFYLLSIFSIIYNAWHFNTWKSYMVLIRGKYKNFLTNFVCFFSYCFQSILLSDFPLNDILYFFKNFFFYYLFQYCFCYIVIIRTHYCLTF